MAKQPNWVSRRIAGETILVPLAGSIADLDSIFVLDEVGSAIWDLLDGQRSTHQIAQMLCETFEVGLEEATADTNQLLDAMREAKLVSIRSPLASRSTTGTTHA